MTSRQEYWLKRGSAVVVILWLVVGPIASYFTHFGIAYNYGGALVTWYMLLPIVAILTAMGGAMFAAAAITFYEWAFEPRKKIAARKIKELEEKNK